MLQHEVAAREGAEVAEAGEDHGAAVRDRGRRGPAVLALVLPEPSTQVGTVNGQLAPQRGRPRRIPSASAGP